MTINIDPNFENKELSNAFACMILRFVDKVTGNPISNCIKHMKTDDN
jgi:hypothetical protein